ncbi:hypothetical protein RSOLAG1IB_05494 [Rhizoctonia solani AG-1 IB]|uniref:Uncharacterized protein n=1 Tax=Thanatephorus cucumeris (strain AG1-IB / isolate 7/3/14) TaxID=1108050 RepID=A0A0B7G5I9_THACB|nr:hypothetical protein RSOLAG1IB_05494 [Rhizoctonia solani AG-1 IB]
MSDVFDELAARALDGDLARLDLDGNALGDNFGPNFVLYVSIQHDHSPSDFVSSSQLQITPPKVRPALWQHNSIHSTHFERGLRSWGCREAINKIGCKLSVGESEVMRSYLI